MWPSTTTQNHQQKHTTSHNFAATTHNHPQSAIILLQASKTTHNLPLFHDYHPFRTLVKNELFQTKLFFNDFA